MSAEVRAKAISHFKIGRLTIDYRQLSAACDRRVLVQLSAPRPMLLGNGTGGPLALPTLAGFTMRAPTGHEEALHAPTATAVP
jgi:hypothetical protein